ncbi:SPOC like C-terminal domain-containing protein [Chiua virens]|nr:SPOC like C-terminal domain-containing protein [Chiua virens]
MPPYDDWNVMENEEDEELQDMSFSEGKRDVILFCIDCSESMHELRDDPVYENVKTSHLLTALDAAMQIQKKKVIVGPNDSVGILLFNTTRPNEVKGYASEIKKNCFVYQQIAPISAPTIHELIRLIDGTYVPPDNIQLLIVFVSEEAREDSDLLRNTFPPNEERRCPWATCSRVVTGSCEMGSVDFAPKTASKRVFLITDDDNPHPNSRQLITSSKTTLIDLTQAGVQVEPFFISTPAKPFDPTKFYSSVLPSNAFGEDEDEEDEDTLPASISITRIDDLLSQMRFHEVPKRALFSIPFELGKGFIIGVKGYGLITEQRKGSYKYFIDLGDRMEVANSRTVYLDEDHQVEVDPSKFLFGGTLGTGPEEAADEDEEISLSMTRTVKRGQRPFYTADEIRSFRTLDLEPGLKLLGFKEKKELKFEDNVKHSLFIYPDELKHSGSKRTFSALLQKMLEKDKIGLVLAIVRRNATPAFCALVPQAETVEEGGWSEPAGFHLIFLPFVDDIRKGPITESFKAPEAAVDAAKAWIEKLCLKNGAYSPDSYPNPALAYHNAQLQASAFREEFDADGFEDLTRPRYDVVHKRAGALLTEWKKVLASDENYNTVIATTGTKRKSDVSVDEADLRSKYAEGTLAKLRVDQLKEVLKSKGLPTSGKKAELMERVGEWLNR